MHVQQSKTYPGSEICSDNKVVVMKYKLQRKKKVYRPAFNNAKLAVNKLKEES